VSANRDVDRIVRSWLHEDAHEDATRILDAILDEIDTTPQRRALWPVRRFLAMNNAMRFGVAAVAVIVIALIGFNLYQGSSLGSSPSASPRASTTPVPAPTPVPAVLARPTDMPTNGACEENSDCLGVLQAGSIQHADVFSPHFTFTAPSGHWQNRDQSDGILTLESIDKPGDFIAFYRLPTPTNPDGSPVRPSVASTADALSTWLASNPQVSTTSNRDVTIGGLKGNQTDVTVAPGSTNRPEGCPVVSCVPVFKGIDPGRLPNWQWDWAIASGEKARVYLLNSPQGVFTIIVDSPDGTTFDALTSTAEGLVATLQFK
jgi:hypothetical protein